MSIAARSPSARQKMGGRDRAPAAMLKRVAVIKSMNHGVHRCMQPRYIAWFLGGKADLRAVRVSEGQQPQRIGHDEER